MSEMKLRAQRPQFCVLSNDKLRGVGIPLPEWRDALARSIRMENALGPGL
jgi:dTDP-4-dehydrorhamnose reductase